MIFFDRTLSNNRGIWLEKNWALFSLKKSFQFRSGFFSTQERSLIFFNVREVIDQLDGRDKPLVQPWVSFT